MKFFSVFGLFLDIVGSVIVLGGIAFQGNKTLGERGGTFIMDDDPSKWHLGRGAKPYLIDRSAARWGLFLLVLGFVFQIIGTGYLSEITISTGPESLPKIITAIGWMMILIMTCKAIIRNWWEATRCTDEMTSTSFIPTGLEFLIINIGFLFQGFGFLLGSQ